MDLTMIYHDSCESRMFGAGSLEHIPTRQSQFFFNIHRERLYAAEPLSSTHV
jgi:hypothetical protein